MVGIKKARTDLAQSLTYISIQQILIIIIVDKQEIAGVLAKAVERGESCRILCHGKPQTRM